MPFLLSFGSPVNYRVQSYIYIYRVWVSSQLQSYIYIYRVWVSSQLQSTVLHLHIQGYPHKYSLTFTYLGFGSPVNYRVQSYIYIFRVTHTSTVLHLHIQGYPHKYSLTFTYIGLSTQVQPIEKFTLAFNPQFYLQKMRLYNIQTQNLQK